MKRCCNESRDEHFLSPFKPYHIFLYHLEFFSAVQGLWMSWDMFPFSIQLTAIKISKPHLFHLQNNYWSQFPDTQSKISMYCSVIHTNNMLYFLIEEKVSKHFPWRDDAHPVFFPSVVFSVWLLPTWPQKTSMLLSIIWYCFNAMFSCISQGLDWDMLLSV